MPETLDPESLRKYFTLTEADLQEVAVCRGATNKLGFAVQLCTLRWQGYFLGDTRGLPAPVLEALARQLDLLPMPIDDYLLTVSAEAGGRSDPSKAQKTSGLNFMSDCGG